MVQLAQDIVVDILKRLDGAWVAQRRNGSTKVELGNRLLIAAARFATGDHRQSGEREGPRISVGDQRAAGVGIFPATALSTGIAT